MSVARNLMTVTLLLVSGPLWATSVEKIFGEQDAEPEKGVAVLPYAFYNDSTEFALATAVIANGYIQPQVDVVFNAFYSTNESYNLFLLFKDMRMPGLDRLFVDALAFNSEWGELESYRNGNPNFADEDAGSNDSSEDNFIESEGSDDQYRVELRYLLPIGHGAGNPIHEYQMHADGTLVDGFEQGADSWNPWVSGRTFLELQLFDRRQDLDNIDGSDTELKTTAVIASVQYDNTDFHKNPSEGSRQSVSFQRDWGMHDDDGAPWTTVEFEYNKFINLGATDTALQRVLALNTWWIDTPTWDDSSGHGDNKKFHRPPSYAGATLGGLDRQRAYPSARFNDRAAINYQLEYRHMPAWNPWATMPIIETLQIRWWQWVAFAELGRVHDEWDVSELHSDMKWSAGAGIRLYVKSIVVRADIASSEEQANVQMFIGHVF